MTAACVCEAACKHTHTKTQDRVELLVMQGLLVCVNLGGLMLCCWPGKVILASDRCCKSSFSSLLKMKTLKALCNKPGKTKTLITTSTDLTWAQKRLIMEDTHLYQCWSWGGSSSWCRLRSCGRPRRWGCTFQPAAAPASHPGGPWWSQASWLQTAGVSPHWGAGRQQCFQIRSGAGHFCNDLLNTAVWPLCDPVHKWTFRQKFTN